MQRRGKVVCMTRLLRGESSTSRRKTSTMNCPWTPSRSCGMRWARKRVGRVFPATATRTFAPCTTGPSMQFFSSCVEFHMLCPWCEIDDVATTPMIRPSSVENCTSIR
ncbi:hypothetical protein, variant 1 [Aphanomyces astaci]|uniref:Uncharacterized protein n=1 Tax=Aphanomyces astaci TaxID=112090 RepID=W4H4L8_APHAT|nr:hypothetical protein H257_01902 [Aphanomyces astaci]XP_009823647.1 hypothetical protein, variant 2 [Aphanomyces astaci]XP_009823648.1 hypothetical protein, variant 3 [Aphanomyces astaci]XP_009823649.1 hypothetical protein, variant 4 [Aphanomyces astaci]XP_009823650.1 hypothetical protein, variant 1 [Aphanomyces astaci]ETV86847.1 hypothetical protein H257_01902 [Aphanomyces astaci]ETV86848.1 hypothetical protein, variant 1 [Aphanomyces astaci]ETV86849.1 hypothetical protein, variant 2 [Aph|eukprot:XP_009823646.1 hypothetical protein H257_01902 [Aphanomyces astaci]